MAASKDILFWTPRGQLLWSKRIIPVTNIAELVEYVLLTHKLLSDLIEKEKGYRNAENIYENESNNEESSSDIENQEEEKVASENGSEA